MLYPSELQARGLQLQWQRTAKQSISVSLKAKPQGSEDSAPRYMKILSLIGHRR